jgi:hypothetical protein
MRANDRQKSSVGPVKRAMAASSVKQHKTLLLQQGNNVSKPDAAWRVAHLLKKLLASAHELVFLVKIA